MAPTIIVGDDENAGDVAARLLELADRQQDVRTRTDTPGTAFEVPDEVYERYTGKDDRGDDEQRVNAIERQQRRQADEGREDLGAIVGDELPDSARHAEPGEGDDLSVIEGDELPASASVIEPPSNGDAPNDGSGFPLDDDPDDEQVEEKPKPKPRKRAPRKTASKPATPEPTTSTPPAPTGDNE